MASEKKRRGGTSKLSRSRTVTVRLDPKLRYIAEIAARKQRRTMSSYIEWAIEYSLKDISINDSAALGKEISLRELSESLWDVEEADRLIRLALHCPGLLNFEEQHQWKAIMETPYFINTNAETELDSIFRDRVRKYWSTIKEYSSGEVNLAEFDSILMSGKKDS